MTRINIGIDPRRLTDEHLLAEHREIKRLPSQYKQSLMSGSINKIPNKFSLGKGHVLFFVDKPKYTLERYKKIREECINRGFKVEDYSSNWEIYPKELFNNTLIETEEERRILIDRISSRIISSPKSYFHFFSESIVKDKAIYLLTI